MTSTLAQIAMILAVAAPLQSETTQPATQASGPTAPPERLNTLGIPHIIICDFPRLESFADTNLTFTGKISALQTKIDAKDKTIATPEQDTDPPKWIAVLGAALDKTNAAKAGPTTPSGWFNAPPWIWIPPPCVHEPLESFATTNLTSTGKISALQTKIDAKDETNTAKADVTELQNKIDAQDKTIAIRAQLAELQKQIDAHAKTLATRTQITNVQAELRSHATTTHGGYSTKAAVAGAAIATIAGVLAGLLTVGLNHVYQKSRNKQHPNTTCVQNSVDSV